jgi:hypothetical protein
MILEIIIGFVIGSTFTITCYEWSNLRDTYRKKKEDKMFNKLKKEIRSDLLERIQNIEKQMKELKELKS